MKNNAIFIGSIYPKNIFDNLIKEQSHIDFAANNFQLSLISGLCNYFVDLKIITSPVTSSYPKSKTLFYKKTNSSLNIIDKFVSVKFTGFINLPILKLISEFFNVSRALRNSINNNEVIFVYALHSPFLLATYFFRKKFSKVCVVIPDLPDYMSHNRGFCRRLFKNINKLIINKCLKNFDYFVLLTHYMKEKLPIEDKKSLVIEGIYTPVNLPSFEKEIKKTILYTGIISSKYGVFDLLEAFYRINGDDYQLWICGSCPHEIDKLNDYLLKDSRIHYFGMLNKDEVYALQIKSTLLVNPRHSNEEFTKYSFPSKTMEYLASGTPTLMCKLPAIPMEYHKHLFFFLDETIEGYKDRIIQICNMDKDYLKIYGSSAREFILGEKTNISQAKRIFCMLNK